MILIKPSYEILTAVDYGEILKRIEAAGRTCYKSEDRITQDSAEGFVRRIIKSGHHSVLEHESLSVRFVCDRGVTHELVRHRLCAYSQESTRYCNYKGGVTFVIPPWVNVEEGEYFGNMDIFVTDPSCELSWVRLMLNSETTYIELLDNGWSPQQARSVLPNSLKTEIVVTANIREWRHIFTLRTSAAAHPQIREVMTPLLRELRDELPVLF